MMRNFWPCALALLGGVLPIAPVVAQTPQLDAWVAWHGCWQAEGAPANEYLCVVPDGIGVRMATVAAGAVVAESRVITDGRPRGVQTDGCTGTEMAAWSADYHRVFLNSELSCEGGVARQVSGVFALTSVGSWVSVQAVTIDGRTATRTVRYNSVEDAVAPAGIGAALRATVPDRVMARSAALAPIDANDVDEAVDRIDAAAAQAWLVATEQPFQLADDAMLESGVRAQSALDQTGSYAQVIIQDRVRIVERPVEIVQVVEVPVIVADLRFRKCWDPFFSGVVTDFGHGTSIGAGHAHCGNRFLTHFSPWGYDLFGWRLVRSRPIFISGRPVIFHCEPNRPARVVHPTRRSGQRHAPPNFVPDRQPSTHYPTRTAQPRNQVQVTSTPPRELPTRTVRPGTFEQMSTPPRELPTRTAQPRTFEPTSTPPRERYPSRVVQPRVYEPSHESAQTRNAISSLGGRTRSAPVNSNSAFTTTTPPRYAQTRSLGVGSTTREQPTSRSSQPLRAAESRGNTSATRGEASMPRTSGRAIGSPSSTTSTSTPAAAQSARVARPRGGDDR